MKAQVTPFVIVGVVLLVLVGIGTYSIMNAPKQEISSSISSLGLSGNIKDSVEKYAEGCLKELTDEGVLLYGLDGSGNLIESYVTEKIDTCLDLSVYENQGYQLEEKFPTTYLEISDEKVIATLNYPFILKRDSSEYVFDEFAYNTGRTNFVSLNKGIADKELSLQSVDKNAILSLPENTEVTVDGKPVEMVSIKIEDAKFNNQFNGIVVGNTIYNLQPSGAVINDGMKLSIRFRPEDLPDGYDLNKLSIAYYNEETGIWNSIPSSLSADESSVSATIKHFSYYGIVIDCYVKSDDGEKSLTREKPAEMDLGFIYLPKYWPTGYDPRAEEETNKEYCEWTKYTALDGTKYYVSPKKIDELKMNEFDPVAFEDYVKKNNDDSKLDGEIAASDKLPVNILPAPVEVTFENHGDTLTEVQPAAAEDKRYTADIKVNPSGFHTPEAPFEMRGRTFDFNAYKDYTTIWISLEPLSLPVGYYVQSVSAPDLTAFQTEKECQMYGLGLNDKVKSIDTEFNTKSIPDATALEEYFKEKGITSEKSFPVLLVLYNNYKNSYSSNPNSEETSKAKLELYSMIKIDGNSGLPECEERAAYLSDDTAFEGSGNIQFYIFSKSNACMPENFNIGYTVAEPLYDDFGQNGVLVYFNPDDLQNNIIKERTLNSIPLPNPPAPSEIRFNARTENILYAKYTNDEFPDKKNVCPQVRAKIFFDDGVNVVEPPHFYETYDEFLDKQKGTLFDKNCYGEWDGPNGNIPDLKTGNYRKADDGSFIGECLCHDSDGKKIPLEFNDCCFVTFHNLNSDMTAAKNTLIDEGKWNDGSTDSPDNNPKYCEHVIATTFPSYYSQSASGLTCYGQNDGPSNTVQNYDKDGKMKGACYCTPTPGGQRQVFPLSVCCETTMAPGVPSTSYFLGTNGDGLCDYNNDGKDKTAVMPCPEEAQATTVSSGSGRCSVFQPSNYQYKCTDKKSGSPTENKILYCCAVNQYSTEDGCVSLQEFKDKYSCKDVSNLVSTETANSHRCSKDGTPMYECDDTYIKSGELCVPKSGLGSGSLKDTGDCSSNNAFEPQVDGSHACLHILTDDEGNKLKGSQVVKYECDLNTQYQNGYCVPQEIIDRNLPGCESGATTLEISGGNQEECLDGSTPKQQCVEPYTLKEVHDDGRSSRSCILDLPECISTSEKTRDIIVSGGYQCQVNGDPNYYQCSDPNAAITYLTGELWTCAASASGAPADTNLKEGDCTIQGSIQNGECVCNSGYKHIKLSNGQTQCVYNTLAERATELPSYTGEACGNGDSGHGLFCKNNVFLTGADKTCINGDVVVCCPDNYELVGNTATTCTIKAGVASTATSTPTPVCNGATWNAELNICECEGNAVYKDESCKQCAINSIPGPKKDGCGCDTANGFAAHTFGNSVQCIQSSLTGQDLPTISNPCDVSPSSDKCSETFITDAKQSCWNNNKLVLCCAATEKIDGGKCVTDSGAQPSSEQTLSPSQDCESGGLVNTNGVCITCSNWGDLTHSVTLNGVTFNCDGISPHWVRVCPSGQKDDGKFNCVCSDNNKDLVTHSWGTICEAKCTSSNPLLYPNNNYQLCSEGHYVSCDDSARGKELLVGGKIYSCTNDANKYWQIKTK
ncbi:MAG: hypothetical protein ABIJ34_00925 [archaeon]